MADLNCVICKDPGKWPEYVAGGVLFICSDCKRMFSDGILLVCQHCNAMTFIPKTPQNIERLKFFIMATTAHFWASDMIVPMRGCPYCVSYKRSVLGERIASFNL